MRGLLRGTVAGLVAMAVMSLLMVAARRAGILGLAPEKIATPCGESGLSHPAAVAGEGEQPDRPAERPEQRPLEGRHPASGRLG